MQQVSEKAARSASVIEQLYNRKFSNIVVSSEGWVETILQDDENGEKHQKFILRMVNDQTLLISHNIDMAPKISQLKINDVIGFKGEYVWNEKGGLIHWTHKSQDNQHADGWLVHKGKLYQ